MAENKKKEISFEESLAELKKLSDKIRSQDTSLEESIKCYEEGMKHYENCSRILKDARQKIESFDIHSIMTEDI